jgi:hypothetical protein
MPMAKQMPCAGHQRAAGIARVQRRVGLDHAVEQPPRSGAQAAAEGADNTGRDRAGEAERIADGHDKLANTQGGGDTKLGMRQVTARQAQHGDIGGGVAADERGRMALAIGQAGLQPMGIGDDMAVGQDVSIWSEDHA